MNEALYQKLVQTAQSGQLITYAELGGVAGLEMSRREDMEEIGRELDIIAGHETANGRPLLPAVVVRSDTKMPGRGLYKYAKAKKLTNCSDELTFFTQELRRVYDAWKPLKP